MSASSVLNEAHEVPALSNASVLEREYHASSFSHSIRHSHGSKSDPIDSCGNALSPWAASGLKRFFDCACVLIALPVVIPIFILVALAIRFTSSGPVLFLQKRMGRNGKAFTIFKFRTMTHAPAGERSSVTTVGNQTFTPVGPFLRRFKLDELPQLFNVLRGEMSLIGPRPKLPEHQIAILTCRPGITGAATLAFAREEEFLARLPKHDLDMYYHSVVLPAKLRLDAEYMSRATLLSDLQLIVDSASRRWDTSVISSILGLHEGQLYSASTTGRLGRQESHGLKVLSREKSFAQAD